LAKATIWRVLLSAHHRPEPALVSAPTHERQVSSSSSTSLALAVSRVSSAAGRLRSFFSAMQRLSCARFRRPGSAPAAVAAVPDEVRAAAVAATRNLTGYDHCCPPWDGYRVGPRRLLYHLFVCHYRILKLTSVKKGLISLLILIQWELPMRERGDGSLLQNLLLGPSS
jgi:hypothetical protein